jgi:hypothetical protein
MGIINLLQNRDNGGLCPFNWQEFMIFDRLYMAGSCQLLNPFISNQLQDKSGGLPAGKQRPYLGIFARP